MYPIIGYLGILDVGERRLLATAKAKIRKEKGNSNHLCLSLRKLMIPIKISDSSTKKEAEQLREASLDNIFFQKTYTCSSGNGISIRMIRILFLQVSLFLL